MKHILKCENCNKFTMKKICSCGAETKSTKAQKYSPQKFAEYRRKARKTDLENRGLL